MKLPIPGFVRRHKILSSIALVAIIVIILLVRWVTKPAVPSFVTAVAQQGDLTQTVEAVGTVISEHDLNLQFASAGVVQSVYVKVVDKVKSGQTLAALRAGNYAADISGAAADVQSAQAQLQALIEGSRPEDIAVVEADVANKQAALNTAKSNLATAEESLVNSQSKLDALKQQADISLSGYVSTASSTISQQVVAAQNALSQITNVFTNNDVQDAVIKGNPGGLSDLNMSQASAQGKLNFAMSKANSISSHDAALQLLLTTRLALTDAAAVVNQAYNIVSSLQTTSSFTTSDQEGYKTTLATQRTNVQVALSAIDSAAKTLQDAAASFNTQIAAEQSNYTSAQGARNRAQSDIASYEAQLRAAQAQLALKKAPARQTDIAAAQARVNQARASLQRAQAMYSNNLIVAPLAGTITQVSIKPGEITPVGPAMTMLGDTPYRIEMFVSEVDTPKVQMTQSGSIELDAFRGTHFALRVSEVDSTATDKDGVSKYRVKLDFVYPHSDLKIGMTGDAEIITGTRKNVVNIPARAVLEDSDGRKVVRIPKDNGTTEDRVVTTGMEGGNGDIEILSGLKAGETVVVLVKK